MIYHDDEFSVCNLVIGTSIADDKYTVGITNFESRQVYVTDSPSNYPTIDLTPIPGDELNPA